MASSSSPSYTNINNKPQSDSVMGHSTHNNGATTTTTPKNLAPVDRLFVNNGTQAPPSSTQKPRSKYDGARVHGSS